ncbi:MAG: glutathione synthase [Alphaproteobacteria bacterium CG11_big_fil_rev_8_21_14_0_20_39_49]|nr:MAG: glutathione synthase [Alphaproteobacteria bacterium CG11_big_fil_rev_8_21_14_0_20_39_49]
MSLKIAVQMDDIASININSDTTFVLALEAQKRGYELLYYQPQQMFLQNGEVFANVQNLSLHRREKDYFELSNRQTLALKDMDVLLMRQDPPYDMNYLTYTYMLDKICGEVMVVNNPMQVRNCPEKIFVTDFAEFMPPTLISADISSIENFEKEHKKIVLKPLYAHGGRDVFKIENNLKEIADKLIDKYKTPIIAQKFIENVHKGDKRIILIDGEFAGAVNRIPEQGSILSNFVQGGHGEKTELTAREKQICESLKPELKKRRLILTGIDVIDGYLTEINVTSPTGIQAINRIENVCLESIFWDAVERIL